MRRFFFGLVYAYLQENKTIQLQSEIGSVKLLACWLILLVFLSSADTCFFFQLKIFLVISPEYQRALI